MSKQKASNIIKTSCCGSLLSCQKGEVVNQIEQLEKYEQASKAILHSKANRMLKSLNKQLLTSNEVKELFHELFTIP